MTKFKSKADKAFDVKLESLLIREVNPKFIDGKIHHEREPMDVDAVEMLFLQYGHYLELIDMNHPMTTTESKNAARMAQDLVGVEHGTGELVYK